MTIKVVMDMSYDTAVLLSIYRMLNFSRAFVLLGDSAYPSNDVMNSIFNEQNLPISLVAFNAVMCPIRTSIEWGYEKILYYWTFLDFKKEMKIQGSDLLPMWYLSVFPTNCLTCTIGIGDNRISKYFDLAPPYH